MAEKKSGGPGVAGAVGVDHIRNRHRLDAVQVAVLRDPRAVASDLDGGEHAEVGELAGEGGVVRSLILEDGANLVLVGEDDVDAATKLAEQPFARGVDHFKRREIETRRAAGGAGRGEHCIGEGAIEHQIPFDVRVTAAGEIGGGDFVGRERHRGAEAGAHRALGVGRDQREAAGIGAARRV